MKNWRTTLAGIIMTAIAGYQIWQNPALASDPKTLAQVLGGAGLIAASDSAKDPKKDDSDAKQPESHQPD